MGSISLSTSLLQSAVGTALQSLGMTGNTTAASGATQPDNTQLSPFAQLMNTLQQLQQSNPTKYAQVTQQISTNLQNAAQTATASGNTAAASQLSQLATDFSNASQTGQLPNIQDLAQAMGGGGGGHHHHASSSGDSSTGGSSSSTDQMISQLLLAFQSNSSQGASTSSTASTDPLSIIMSTLANAGITNASA